MKKLLISMLITTVFTTAAFSNDTWGYQGENGPEHWDKFSAVCSTGKEQSPINIPQTLTLNKEPITFNYQASAATVFNDGNTIKVTPNVNNFITFKGVNYQLDSFHFHAPSEHVINDQSFPLEVHFVHKNNHEKLLVIGVLFSVGNEENVELQELLKVAPKTSGISIDATNINPRALIPTDFEYYNFNGSLTTPPCTEGVTWIIINKHPSITKGQIDLYKSILKIPNNRPIQPINARNLSH